MTANVNNVNPSTSSIITVETHHHTMGSQIPLIGNTLDVRDIFKNIQINATPMSSRIVTLDGVTYCVPEYKVPGVKFTT